MNSINKKTIFIFIVTLILLSCLTVIGLSKDGVDYSKKEIRIAGVDSVTGKYGDYGTGNKRGQELAIAEINEKGGIQSGPLKGFKLKGDFFDDKGDAKEAANIARKISVGDYLVAVGPTMSSPALSIAPVLYRQRVPGIVTYAQAISLTQQGFDNIIRLTYTTKSVGCLMADEIANNIKKHRVSIIVENQDYGQQLVKSFVGRIKEKKYDIKIISQDVVVPGQDIDFRSVILKAKAKKPDMLFIAVCYNEGGMIVRQARKMGWTVPMYGPNSLTEAKFFELAGDLGEFYIEASQSLKVSGGFAGDYIAKYNTEAPMSAIFGYDGVKIAARIIEMGGVDRESFIGKLRKVSMPGLGNPVYEFDEYGDVKAPALVMMTGEEFKEEYNIK
jgi:ABC-type branched-subunit amino acid transport system substrate-binding protein